MSDHKKPGVVFWATTVLVMVVLYGLSFGPACWISSRTGVGVGALPFVYRPFTMAMRLDGDYMPPFRWPVGTLGFDATGIVDRYATLGAADNWNWQWVVEVRTEGEVNMNEGRWQWKKKL